MQLDIPTLTVAGSFVAFLSGLIVAGAWTQVPRTPALLWWAVAILLIAMGTAFLSIGDIAHLPILTPIAMGCFVASPALVWGGVRHFAGRRTPLPALGAGLVLWLAVNFVPLPYGQLLTGVASFLPAIVYLSAAIYELWRERRETLPARWALIGLFGVQALTLTGGIVAVFAGHVGGDGLPSLETWFGVINFESLLYSIGSAVFMILMDKERRERAYIAAGRKDSLTGIANRGALLDSGERLLLRCQTSGKSFSLIMFDLDHFKRINDTFGHAAGDQVIRAFASATLSILRPNDLFGRYGGEEFIVVLPGATVEAAYVIADRIRNGFAATTIAIGDTPVSGTVSAGVASAGSAAATLEEIIKVADDCLYRAKANGRNRVERPARAVDEPATNSVIRVA